MEWTRALANCARIARPRIAPTRRAPARMARLRHLLHAVALAHRAVGKRRVLHLHQRLARVPLVVLRVVVVADAQLGLPLVHLKLAPRVLRRLAREDRRLEHPLPPVLRLRLRRVLRRLQRVDGVVPARLRREADRVGVEQQLDQRVGAQRRARRRRVRTQQRAQPVGHRVRVEQHRRRRHEAAAAVGQARGDRVAQGQRRHAGEVDLLRKQRRRAELVGDGGKETRGAGRRGRARLAQPVER